MHPRRSTEAVGANGPDGGNKDQGLSSWTAHVAPCVGGLLSRPTASTSMDTFEKEGPRRVQDDWLRRVPLVLSPSDTLKQTDGPCFAMKSGSYYP